MKILLLIINVQAVQYYSLSSTNLIPKSSFEDHKLIKSICKIASEIVSSKTDTQDILIANSGGQMWSSIVNDITKCIYNGTAVVVTDLKTNLVETTLRRAEVVILALNQIDEVNFHQILTLATLYLLSS